MYHKDVVDTVGYFDEKLTRTEDNEYHYRIRKNGFKIWYDTSIESFNIFVQPLQNDSTKFANGYWIGLTSHVCRDCLSLFHFGPGVFVATLLVLMMFDANQLRAIINSGWTLFIGGPRVIHL